jgi:hypothetical protein
LPEEDLAGFRIPARFGFSSAAGAEDEVAEAEEDEEGDELVEARPL